MRTPSPSTQQLQAWPLACLLLILSCTNGSEQPKTEGTKQDPQQTVPIQPAETSPPGGNTAALAESTPSADVAVFAILAEDDARMYDGLYDSNSNYFKFCGSSNIIKVEDRSKLRLEPENKCYQQTILDEMIVISKPGEPSTFATILNIDSTRQKLLAITTSNDTILLPTSALKPAALLKLKQSFQERPVLRPEEIQRVNHYYKFREVQERRMRSLPGVK